MDDIEQLLDEWFSAEYSVRTTRFGEGRNLQGMREDAHQARKNLAYALAKLGRPE